MKWAYSIQQKFKIALLLLVVLVLVLVKNIIDRNNVSKLGNSFSSVYEDRLLVESYIYELSDHLYRKKIMVDDCRSTEHFLALKKRITTHNIAIDTIVDDYARTKLTEAESFYFQAFQNNIADMKELEASYLNQQSIDSLLAQDALRTKMDEQFNAALRNLHQLSSIQISEGKLLQESSQRIVAGSSILTQFELILLIGIGICIQILIFASKSIFPKKPQQHQLN